MSKIRNSLGVLVLPIPEEEMTWERYEAKYGIDLNDVVSYSETHGGLVLKTTKLVCLSGLLSVIGWSPEIIPVVVSFKGQLTVGGDTHAYILNLGVLTSPDDDDGTTLNNSYLVIKKSIDGSPNTISYV